MKKNKLAFSLVELAVVVLVIGLITAGIMKGTSIVRSARISSARSITVNSHIAEIPGMVAWYETSMIESLNASQVSDTSPITNWYDISPGSIAEQKNTLARSVSDSALTYKAEGINNIPSIQFIATTNMSLSSLYQGDIGRSTIFIVMRPTITVGIPIMYLLDSAPSSSSPSAFGIAYNYVYMDTGSGGSTGTTTNSASFTINSNYIMAVYFNSDNSKAFVNDAVNMAGGSALSLGNNPISGLTIGSQRINSKGFNGLISEIIIYNHALSVEERKSVMSYLSRKYKITVAGI